MKLNRKGYLTVEVILASVMAITIAFFLMEITIKLVNTTDDIFAGTELLTDKALIMKNVKGLLDEDIKNNGGIKRIIYNENNSYYLVFCSENYDDNRLLYIDNENIIKCEDDSQNQNVLYNKELNKNLDGIVLTASKTGVINDGDYVLFKITANNKFSKDDFEVNIIVYNNKTCS